MNEQQFKKKLSEIEIQIEAINAAKKLIVMKRAQTKYGKDLKSIGDHFQHDGKFYIVQRVIFQLHLHTQDAIAIYECRRAKKDGDYQNNIKKKTNIIHDFIKA